LFVIGSASSVALGGIVRPYQFL